MKERMKYMGLFLLCLGAIALSVLLSLSMNRQIRTGRIAVYATGAAASLYCMVRPPREKDDANEKRNASDTVSRKRELP